MFILCGVSTCASAPSSSLCKTGGHETAIQGFGGNVGKSPRKRQVHLAFIVHVGRIRRKNHERSIACLLGSGTYLECTVADVALRNHQSPSELEMLLCRKKSCHVLSIYSTSTPLCPGCLGGAAVEAVQDHPERSPNEPRLRPCCPQLPTMIQSACCISSMYCWLSFRLYP